MTFGDWYVIGKTRQNKHGDWYFNCQCKCGSTKETLWEKLKYRRTTSCRSCAGKRRVKGKIGDKFGMWTVIAFAGQKKFLCRCNCGTEKEVEKVRLYSGKSSQCRKCLSLQSTQHHYEKWWRSIITNATSRGLKISITKDHALGKLRDQKFKCAISGIDLYLNKGVVCDQTETTASLDRIDSNIGYTTANIQWVHKDINIMKKNHSQEYFVQLCRRVAEQSLYTVVPARTK